MADHSCLARALAASLEGASNKASCLPSEFLGASASRGRALLALEEKGLFGELRWQTIYDRVEVVLGNSRTRNGDMASVSVHVPNLPVPKTALDGAQMGPRRINVPKMSLAAQTVQDGLQGVQDGPT